MKTKVNEIKPMNPKAKELWVQALRSGKYIKICQNMCRLTSSGKLNIDKNEMCVMGVLADVALLNSGLKHTVQNYNLFSTGIGPTERTLKWSGLDRKIVNKLIRDNDSRKKDFPEFADYISKNL